jgi:hypothetical protein
VVALAAGAELRDQAGLPEEDTVQQRQGTGLLEGTPSEHTARLWEDTLEPRTQLAEPSIAVHMEPPHQTARRQ